MASQGRQDSDKRQPHECNMSQDILLQLVLSLAYFAFLVTVMRLAAKRLAGQTNTFDRVILVTI